MEDIFFYDLDLNRLHTLPPSGSKSGYIMVNTRQEFRGDGSAQINFWSDDLCNIIRAHPEGVIFRIGKFEGVITDYNFKKDEKTLESCYLSSLSAAENAGLESVAFCCISTGEYGFPNDRAAKIAVGTVSEFLKKSVSVKKVIFDVFTEKDRRLYERELSKIKREN